MKPLFALLPSGSYVALHLCHYFCVLPSDSVQGAWDVIGTRPGEEDMTVLCTVEGYGERGEFLARGFLRGIIDALAQQCYPNGVLDVSAALDAFLKGYTATSSEAGKAFADDATAILEREA